MWVTNEREIHLKNCKATDIIFTYLNNFDFLTESLNNLIDHIINNI